MRSLIVLATAAVLMGGCGRSAVVKKPDTSARDKLTAKLQSLPVSERAAYVRTHMSEVQAAMAAGPTKVVVKNGAPSN